MFLLNYILFVPKEHYVKVLKIESPQKFILENGIYEIENLVCFDSSFSERNKFLAQKLGITEYEAFVLGNVAKYKITVPDAVEKIKNIPNIQITKNTSGNGAFREIVDILIKN